MKKVIVLSAIVLFAVAAFAQTSSKNGHGKAVSSNAKETTLKGKEKGQSVSDIAKANGADEIDNNIKLSKEEKQARKAAKKAEIDARRTDRVDDDNRLDDLDNGEALSREEKDARKAARKAENDARKADRVEDDDRVDDLDRDGTLSREEKEARKASRKAENDAKKADRDDDGVLNGSADANNIHGKTVSGMAHETTLEGREKGASVSSAASSKARNAERVKTSSDVKANRAGRPTAAAKKAGTGRFGKLR